MQAHTEKNSPKFSRFFLSVLNKARFYPDYAGFFVTFCGLLEESCKK